MISVQGNESGVGALAPRPGLSRIFPAGMIRGRERRFLASLLPAAFVTCGLYLAMTELIRTDEVVLVEKPQRILTDITPEREIDDTVRIKWTPAPIVNVNLPPMPPVTRKDSKVEGLPVPVIGPGDWGLTREVINFQPPPPQPMGERTARPVRLPAASYPQSMAARGLEGTCNVHFSLSARGLPYDIDASCSHPGFEKEAAKAVGKAEFLPEIRQGVPVQSHNYVYPMEFRLQ